METLTKQGHFADVHAHWCPIAGKRMVHVHGACRGDAGPLLVAFMQFLLSDEVQLRYLPQVRNRGTYTDPWVAPSNMTHGSGIPAPGDV